MTKVVPGLRERKRAATEHSVIDAAMKLFAQRGFVETTIDDIAAAAGIGRRTFFRYFPTKEDIVLDHRRLDRGFARTALRQGPGRAGEVEHVMRVLGEVQQRAFALFQPEHQRLLHRLSHDEPALAARSFLLMQEMRELVVGALTPKRASRPERLRVQLLAMACIVAIDTSITMWIEGGMKEDLGRILAEASACLREGFSG